MLDLADDAMRMCPGCSATFARNRANTRRFCSTRCRVRSRAAATRVIAFGWARVGKRRTGADQRERPLRCADCGRELGYALDARALILEQRVVVQLVDRGLRLAVECVGCQQLRQVLAVPAVAASTTFACERGAGSMRPAAGG